MMPLPMLAGANVDDLTVVLWRLLLRADVVAELRTLESSHF